MKYINQEQLDAFLNDRSLKALAPSAPSTGSGTGTGLNDALLEKMNVMAVAKIDGYLRGVYSLPLVDPVDGMLFTLCGNLMRYYLYERRDAANIPDKILELYKFALKDLEQIQKRNIVLEVADPETGEQETATLNAIVYKTPTQKFGSHFTGFDGL